MKSDVLTVLRIGICIAIMGIVQHAYAIFPSLAKNDPFPMYTSAEFVDGTLLILKDELSLDVETAALADERHNFMSLSISPFAQNATVGRNIKGQYVFGGQPLGLGDITSGRTSMIALMFGRLPEGRTLPSSLQAAFDNLFPGMAPGTIDDGNYIDPKQLFGYFSFPLKYRKRGARFEISMHCSDFGFIFQTGVASIRQTVTDGFICTPPEICTPSSDVVVRDTPPTPNPTQAQASAAFEKEVFKGKSNTNDFISVRRFDGITDELRAVDMTPRSTDESLKGITQGQVECYLMSQLRPIMSELGLDICDYCATSIEPICLSLFWRKGYELNRGRDEEWPHVVIIPHILLGTEVSVGKKTDPNKLLSVPFGNNGHTNVGFRAGISFDFIDTIEIGAEGGMAHFFSKSVDCLRVPNSRFQTGVYPFTVPAQVRPGYSWFFGLRMYAFHFVDNLSLSFEYLMIEHKCDRIILKKKDPAFLPECLEKTTGWKSKMVDVAFNYDISPNVAIGVLWQAPLSQRNSYKSTTIMLTFNAVF